jgi:soluble lytic murein transglycosylase-like protein
MRIKDVAAIALFTTFLLGGLWPYRPAITPPRITVQAPTEASIKDELRRKQLQEKYDVAEKVVGRFLRQHHRDTVYAKETAHAAVDHGLNPTVFAAVVFYESGFNPRAVSGRKSVGLTQINPTVWKKQTVEQLFDVHTNLNAGAEILAGYIREFGLREGLHRYNGLGTPTNPTGSEYADSVLMIAGIRDMERSQ